MFELVAPATVGLSAERLNRIAPHLDRYVDEGKLPGYLMLVARRGQPAYLHRYGLCDVENQKPVADDTIFRIYSMTKPITSVAILQLYERGLFQLNTPVSTVIPAFKGLQVYTGGEGDGMTTAAAQREVTFRDLLTHTAGFVYGTSGAHPLDSLYRDRQMLTGSLAEMISKLSDLPLLFSPGTRWNYSLATDILGYLVEQLSGQSLDRYFAEQILEPLGMVDTAFFVPPAKQSRFAANYSFHEGGFRLIDNPATSPYLNRQPSVPAAAGWSPPAPTTSALPRCCSTRANSTACAFSVAKRWR